MELLTWKQDKKVVQIYLLGKADEVLADSAVVQQHVGSGYPAFLIMRVDLQVWWCCAETKRGSRC